MKIKDWNTLEEQGYVYIESKNKWYKLSKSGNKMWYIKKEFCKNCGEPFLAQVGNKGEFCSTNCSNSGIYSPNYGKKHSEETKKKIGKKSKGRKHTDETKKKISKNKRGISWGKHTDETKKKLSLFQKNRKRKPLTEEHKRNIGKSSKGRRHTEETKKKMSGENGNNWKGGYFSKGIPTYDTYAPQLEWCEEVRRNKDDPNILEVKCFKCDRWYIPTQREVRTRLNCIYGYGNSRGEGHLYCSKECKNSCSIYYKKPYIQIEKNWLELRREVQPELRSMVLERDEHKCIKCNSSENLQCHHILPVNIEPLLSADIDNCVTLCKECHIKVHKKDGCKYSQLKIKEC